MDLGMSRGVNRHPGRRTGGSGMTASSTGSRAGDHGLMAAGMVDETKGGVAGHARASCSGHPLSGAVGGFDRTIGVMAGNAGIMDLVAGDAVDRRSRGGANIGAVAVVAEGMSGDGRCMVAAMVGHTVTDRAVIGGRIAALADMVDRGGIGNAGAVTNGASTGCIPQTGVTVNAIGGVAINPSPAGGGGMADGATVGRSIMNIRGDIGAAMAIGTVTVPGEGAVGVTAMS